MIDIIDIKIYDENDYLLNVFANIDKYENYVNNTPDKLLAFTYPEFTVKTKNGIETMTPEEYYETVLNKS